LAEISIFAANVAHGRAEPTQQHQSLELKVNSDWISMALSNGVSPNPVVKKIADRRHEISSESHGRHTWTSVLLQTLNTGNVGKTTINHP